MYNLKNGRGKTRLVKQIQLTKNKSKRVSKRNRMYETSTNEKMYLLHSDISLIALNENGPHSKVK